MAARSWGRYGAAAGAAQWGWRAPPLTSPTAARARGVKRGAGRKSPGMRARPAGRLSRPCTVNTSLWTATAGPCMRTRCLGPAQKPCWRQVLYGRIASFVSARARARAICATATEAPALSSSSVEGGGPTRCSRLMATGAASSAHWALRGPVPVNARWTSLEAREVRGQQWREGCRWLGAWPARHAIGWAARSNIPLFVFRHGRCITFWGFCSHQTSTG